MNNYPELSIFRSTRLDFVQSFYQKILLLFCLTVLMLIGTLLIGVSVAVSPPKSLPGKGALLTILEGYADDLERSLASTPFVDIEPYRGFPTNISLVITSSSNKRQEEIASNAFILSQQDHILRERLALSPKPIVVEDADTIAVGPVQIDAHGEIWQLMMFWKKEISVWRECIYIIASYPVVVLFSLLGSTCFCLLLARMLRPLRIAQRRAQEIAAGDLEVRLPRHLTSRRDEIGELCRDFNTMAERLQDMHENRERLLRHVSHELRTPLTRIQLALALAKNKAQGVAQSEHDRMERDISHLDYLIGQILTWSRVVNFSRNRPQAWFLLDEVVQALVDDADFEAAMDNRSVALVQMCPDCHFYGDRNRVASAVENLVRNAIRFSPKNDTVKVRMSCNNQTIEIVVRDHGRGVMEDDIDFLFEPFYRVDVSHGGDNRGTGLGLTIAKAAVEGHGGTITARNANPGLEMTITLPVPKEPLSPPPQPDKRQTLQ